MPRAPKNQWTSKSYVDPVAAAYSKEHSGLRSYGDYEVPAYVDGRKWLPVPHRVNNYAGKQPLPERCKAETLSVEDTQQKGPNGAPIGECFQLDLRRDDQTQPVLPTLFVPGFPKAATTWLYECMHHAFVPEMVCADPPRGPGKKSAIAAIFGRRAEEQRALAQHGRGGVGRGGVGQVIGRGELEYGTRGRRLGAAKAIPKFDPNSWNKTNCHGRRYMLPGIACSVTGGCSHRKELFFYGAGFGDYFRVGMAALHGPELPLELFVKNEGATARSPALGRHQWDYYRVRRFEEFCTNPKYTHLPPGRMHPSCCVARSIWPKRWGCRWHESLRLKYGRSRSMWFQTAMPWVKPTDYEFASVDFTPNYLCHAGALQNIYSTARDPSELRFVVLMRDPIMRAFSEWSMFALGWYWDHEPSFYTKVTKQMDTFRKCSGTLFGKPELLEHLPNEELFAYMKKCFKGMAMEYITNSLYPICIAGALRIFKREQFLFLRFEDLMRMKAPAILQLISNFTGLYTDDSIISKVRAARECEAGRARKVPLSFTAVKNGTKENNARSDLQRAMPAMEAFFKPYDGMLRSIIGPAFGWSAATHPIPKVRAGFGSGHA